jgi:hypothetical protein
MMAHRTVGPLFAYVDDYGPHRWAQIVVDPRDVHAGPTCAVALRRQPTTPDEAQRHLDAIPADWFAPAWERSVAESERSGGSPRGAYAARSSLSRRAPRCPNGRMRRPCRPTSSRGCADDRPLVYRPTLASDPLVRPRSLPPNRSRRIAPCCVCFVWRRRSRAAHDDSHSRGSGCSLEAEAQEVAAGTGEAPA